MTAPAFDLDVNISGFDGVLDRLLVLTEQLQKKGARAAVRKAMVPVRERARLNAKAIDDENTNDPSKPDYSMIWKNIVINESARGGRRVGGIVMRVGVRGGALSKVTRTLTTDVPRPGVSGLGEGRRSGGQRVKVFKPVKTFVIHPGGDTRHWRFVELGTQRMRARAFLLPALAGHEQQITDDLAEQLKLQIDKLTLTPT